MKKKFAKIFLFALPFMAFILGTTNDSVKLVNMTTGETVTGSYFTMLSDSVVAIFPSFAAFCSIVAMVTAAIYIFKKKRGILRFSAWASFAGACFAVIPVAARGENMILPNVFFPILLLGHFVLCAFSKKWNLEETEQPQGRRLPQR